MIVPITTALVPFQVASFKEWKRINIRVLTPNSIRIGQSKIMLEGIDGAGVGDGLQLQQSDGIYQEYWRGDLWVVADVQPAKFSLLIMDGLPSAFDRQLQSR